MYYEKSKKIMINDDVNGIFFSQDMNLLCNDSLQNSILIFSSKPAVVESQLFQSWI